MYPLIRKSILTVTEKPSSAWSFSKLTSQQAILRSQCNKYMETKTKDLMIIKNLEGENPLPTIKRMAFSCCDVSHCHKTLILLILSNRF